MPNITGSITNLQGYISKTSGAFLAKNHDKASWQGNIDYLVDLTLDLSVVDDIYGSSTTVQPDSIKALFLVRI